MKWKKLALLAFSGAGLYSVVNASAQAGTFKHRKKIFYGKPFWVIAHRGFSGRFPENTMLAFEQAAALPIDAIELDVHSSRDGKIVVIHDPILNRTTGFNGRVFDQTWDHLRKLDAAFLFDPEGNGKFPFRGQGITIPLLEDVFKRFPRMKFIIEIKQTLPAIEEPVYRLIRQYRMEDRVVVASEYEEPLLRFRRLAPTIATNLSSREAREFYTYFRLRLTNFHEPDGDALQIPTEYKGEKVVTPGLVSACKRKGLIIHVWTVNDEIEMHYLISCGVDGILTDFPDRLLNVISSPETPAVSQN